MVQLINRSKIRQLTLYPSKIIQAAVYFDEAINTYTLIEGISSRTDCSAEKTCLCWKKQHSCALNITLSNANITNSGNQRNVTGAIQIFPADKDPRCYCCQRVSEEAN